MVLDGGILLPEIIDNVPHYIFWKDQDLIFRGCNRKFYEQFGFTSALEVIGKRDEDFSWPRDLVEKYKKDDALILETEIPLLSYEESQVQLNKTVHILLVSKVPLRDAEGNVCGVLGIYTDITKQKTQEWKLQRALEQVKELNRVKSEFIANMSHDLRTPLSGIAGLSEILEKSVPTDEAKQYLREITASAHSLMKITDEILESSSADLGMTQYQESHFKLQDIFVQLEELVKPTVRAKHLDFSMDIDSSVPEDLYGFHILIHRVLLNLISNALKFTREGRVIIKASFQEDARAPGNGILLLDVSDTGIGVPAEMQSEIFEPFARLSPSYKGLYPGAGLGLYLAKAFIERMEGEIKVESSVSQGTIFSCRIPIEKSDSAYQTHKGWLAALENMRADMSQEAFNRSKQFFTDDQDVAVISSE